MAGQGEGRNDSDVDDLFQDLFVGVHFTSDDLVELAEEDAANAAAERRAIWLKLAGEPECDEKGAAPVVDAPPVPAPWTVPSALERGLRVSALDRRLEEKVAALQEMDPDACALGLPERIDVPEPAMLFDR
jgi:hypothetical protein